MTRLIAWLFGLPLVWCYIEQNDEIRLKIAWSMNFAGDTVVWFVGDFIKDTLHPNGRRGSYGQSVRWKPANDAAKRLIPRNCEQ